MKPECINTIFYWLCDVMLSNVCMCNVTSSRRVHDVMRPHKGALYIPCV